MRTFPTFFAIPLACFALLFQIVTIKNNDILTFEISLLGLITWHFIVTYLQNIHVISVRFSVWRFSERARAYVCVSVFEYEWVYVGLQTRRNRKFYVPI